MRRKISSPVSAFPIYPDATDGQGIGISFGCYAGVTTGVKGIVKLCSKRRRGAGVARSRQAVELTGDATCSVRIYHTISFGKSFDESQ